MRTALKLGAACVPVLLFATMAEFLKLGFVLSFCGGVLLNPVLVYLLLDIYLMEHRR